MITRLELRWAQWEQPLLFLSIQNNNALYNLNLHKTFLIHILDNG
jgi:hypothetical protein